jgi:Putative beta-barrel porin-2, OmpL-like. bbp2
VKNLNSNRRTALTMAAVAGLVLFSFKSARADAPVISGFIDTTYNYNFNMPNTQTNELRSFDSKDNTFLLNAAQLQVMGTMGDVGYVVKFLAGTDASVITSAGAGAGDDFDLQEAYMTYLCPMSKLNLKVGKFATPMGIEVIESKDDATISRGYLFGLAEAYTHTGLMLNRAFGAIDIGAGVVNGWDVVSDNNQGKTFIGKVALNLGDPFTLTVSGLHGPEQSDTPATPGLDDAVHKAGNNRDSLDAVLVTKIIPRVTLALQGNIGTEENAVGTSRDNWAGAGVQPIIQITDKFSIGSRLEYFTDEKGSRLFLPAVTNVNDLAMTNFTITPAFKMADNMTFRLEYRYDTASKKIFLDDEGTLKDTSSSVGAQWLVTF